ncbi:MAG: AAA family ATPase, partial [Actinomycetota bacterium]
MRPLELYMDGFKSYSEPVSFDFEGRGLFGIVGPTGSGKSTILEALIFALYGKTPRVQRDSKKLINSQSDEARVRLCFEADGIAWQADRVIRRKGAAAVALKRLDGAGEPVGGDRLVSERIAEILGLDFEAFCSSVSLPQNEFDRFLNASPAQRTEILKGLFRLERVDRLREAAKGRQRFIEGQIQTLQRDVSAVPEDAEDRLAEARARVEQDEEKLGRIEAAMPAVLEAQRTLDLSRHEMDSLKDSRRRIEEALARLPSGESLSDLESRREGVERRAADAEKAAVKAEQLLEEANLVMQRLDAAGRSEQWCADLKGRINERGRLGAELQQAAAELEAAEKEIARLQPGATKAESAVKEAEASLEAARKAVDELRDRHAAHHLRSRLHSGEKCPVCDQPVAAVPAATPLPALEEATAAARQAESRLGTQRRQAEQIGREFAVAQD